MEAAELWHEVLRFLRPLDLARLRLATWQRPQGLAKALSLHACHALDAPLLNFVWGTGRLASGDDGWETLLGSVLLDDCDCYRWRWMLEVIKLDGLIAVGVAAVGASLGWGWELTRKSVEAVGPGSLSSVQAPPSGRAVLLLHLAPFQERLQLELHLFERKETPRVCSKSCCKLDSEPRAQR